MSFGERVGQRDEVAPVVLGGVRFLGINGPIWIGSVQPGGCEVGESALLVRQRVGATDAVDISAAIGREMVLGEIGILNFITDVEAEARSSRASAGPVHVLCPTLVL